ncbi:MAG TPA: glycosyltransferase [Bryobacteraceae bacterium]|nr:glycosyltransferase [Bryobacteraceae bacterium]
MTGVSVIFAAYNEEMNIASTIEKALAAMRELGREFEIVIVDDRSTDATGRIADKLSTGNPEIRVLHNHRNRGQGASLVRGFHEARYDLVIHNAMDYPFDLRDLPKLLDCCGEADIVVASRTSRAGYSLYRVLTSVVHKNLLHLLFPLRLSDYNFVQLYPRSVWEAIRVEARSTAFLTPEALIRAYDMGYRVKEVPIEYHPRLAGEATSGKPKVILHALRDMFSFWWKRLIHRTPQLRDTRI